MASEEHVLEHNLSQLPAATRARRFTALPQLRRRNPLDSAIPEATATRRTLRRDAFYRRSLAFADISAAMLAVVLAIGVLGDDRVKVTVVIAMPVVVLIGKVVGLYDRDELLIRKTTLDEAPALFQVTTFAVLVTWLLEPVLIEGSLGSGQVLALWALLFALLMLGRGAARRAVRFGTQPERCLVIGDAPGAAQVLAKLHGSPHIKATVLGRVPLAAAADDAGGHGIETLGSLDELGLILMTYEVERVIIAPTAAQNELLLDAIRMVKALGVKVSVLPRLFEVVGSSVEFDDVDGVMLLGVRRFGLTQSSQILKRSMDFVGACAGLVLLSPLLLAAAVAVRLGSPGPILFRQNRIGRDGQEIEIYKFRTMVCDAEELKDKLRHRNETKGLFKIADDPRITPVGRVLRKTCVDELPQLFNVLRGEMSLVGPRPLVPSEDRMIEGYSRNRLHFLPGMTGYWQVSGSSRIPLDEMVKIDYLYGANWSLWGDVKILIRTIPYALSRRGM